VRAAGLSVASAISTTRMRSTEMKEESPMPRDKAEAMKSPMAGDRWTKDSRGLNYYRKIGLVNGVEIIYFDASGQTCATNARAFRRWSADAEFLGGSDA